MSALESGYTLGEGTDPIIYNVMNFAKPLPGKPALLWETDIPSTGASWTPDGANLVIFDRVGGTLVRHHRATGRQTPLPKVDVESGAFIASFSPLGDGSTALVQTMKRTTDVVAFDRE